MKVELYLITFGSYFYYQVGYYTIGHDKTMLG